MLCLLAQHFPRLTENLLERSKHLRRSFREDTITDLLMAHLVAVGAGSIIVEFPDEPVTGADMEWTFVNRDAQTSFQLLIQAKKLSEVGPDWNKHHYRELFHRSGPARTLQVELLCQTSAARAATYPLYIFYNPKTSCDLARASRVTTVSGATLCDAHIVRALAKKGNKSHSRTLGVLNTFFFNLADIFCPSNMMPIGPMMFSKSSIPVMLSIGKNGPVLGRSIPPRPDQVRDRLISAQNATRQLLEAQGVSIALPDIPKIQDFVPEGIQALIDSFGVEQPEKPGRRNIWRVVFLSYNATDG
jgi:hypothetical protein